MKRILCVLGLLAGALTANAQTNITAQLINGTPQADQFAGADMCQKLQQANIYALQNGLQYVDATHFTGTQSCSVDPFAYLNGTIPGNPSGATNATLHLTDRLGAVVVNSSVPVKITNNGFHLEGAGYAVTWWRYTGSATVPAVMSVISPAYNGGDSPSTDIDDVTIRDISILGSTGNATDALHLYASFHSDFSNISTWGVTGCGIATNFAVTDTFYRPRTSYVENGQLGYGGSTPAHGLCFDGAPGGGTTDGTVIDAAAEGLTGTGWMLNSALSMTFTSGTSESNNTSGSSGYGGVDIEPPSAHNTFIGIDMEGNGGPGGTGSDALDNANDDSFIHAIAVSGSGIVAGPTSQFLEAETTTGNFAVLPGAGQYTFKRGGEFVAHDAGSNDFNGGGISWNRLGNGELDLDTDVLVGPFAGAFWAHQGSSYVLSGGFEVGGAVVLTGAAGPVPSGMAAIGSQVQYAAASGVASALPGNPAGYMVLFIGSQPYKIPIFNY